MAESKKEEQKTINLHSDQTIVCTCKAGELQLFLDLINRIPTTGRVEANALLRFDTMIRNPFTIDQFLIIHSPGLSDLPTKEPEK